MIATGGLCVICKMQYVEKSEACFNIRVNNHRKDIKKSNAVEACEHFTNNKHKFSKQCKLIITEQLLI